MNSDYVESEQGAFWRGDFGNAYLERNACSAERIATRSLMWQRILRPIAGALPKSVLEVGANAGTNLLALKSLVDAEMHGLEPNQRARAALVASGAVAPSRTYDGFADVIPLRDSAVDMAFTCGVLIHIAPERLHATYDELYRVASKYLLTVEYFSDRDEEVTYRGHSGKLFKRDFGAVWLDRYTNLELVDYGFFWKRATGLDNLTWWMFRKA